jgi:hypothetical protein
MTGNPWGASVSDEAWPPLVMIPTGAPLWMLVVWAWRLPDGSVLVAG